MRKPRICARQASLIPMTVMLEQEWVWLFERQRVPGAKIGMAP